MKSHQKNFRNNRPQSQVRLDGPAVVGRNAVTEMLRRAPERVLRVISSAKDSNERDDLLDEIEQRGIPRDFCSREQLTTALGTDSHQGIAAVIRPREHPELRELLDGALQKERSVVLILDSIYDPHNLGAILRACECFGVAGVIISKNRGTGITSVVTKTSVGASEFVPICIVSNLAQALTKAVDAGFTAIAADVGEDTVSLEKFSFPDHALLILGSEGEGIQPLLRRSCQQAITIPMLGKIDSLNVSQAAAVLLFSASVRR